MASCQRPVPITEAEMTSPVAQELAWQNDRKRLVICAGRHAAATDWITGTLTALEQPTE